MTDCPLWTVWWRKESYMINQQIMDKVTEAGYSGAEARLLAERLTFFAEGAVKEATQAAVSRTLTEYRRIGAHSDAFGQILSLAFGKPETVTANQDHDYFNDGETIGYGLRYEPYADVYSYEFTPLVFAFTPAPSEPGKLDPELDDRPG